MMAMAISGTSPTTTSSSSPPHLHHHHHHQTHHGTPASLCCATAKPNMHSESQVSRGPLWTTTDLVVVKIIKMSTSGDFLLTVRMMTMMMTMVRKALLIPSVNVEGRGRGKGEQQPQGRHPKPAPNLWKKKCLYFDAYPVFILTPTPHLWKRV